MGCSHTSSNLRAPLAAAALLTGIIRSGGDNPRGRSRGRWVGGTWCGCIRDLEWPQRPKQLAPSPPTTAKAPCEGEGPSTSLNCPSIECEGLQLWSLTGGSEWLDDPESVTFCRSFSYSKRQNGRRHHGIIGLMANLK